MSYVELVDDVHSRRLRVPSLGDPIRIELDGDTTRVYLPKTVEVVREEAESTMSLFGDPTEPDTTRSRGDAE